MGLAYATSNRGACHLRGYTVALRSAGQSRSRPTRSPPKASPKLVIAFQDATAAFDSAGICIFTSFAWTPGRRGSRKLAAACGPEFTLENLAKIGERIWNMERDFNNRAGFTAKDDSLPQAAAQRSRPRPARPRAWSTSCPRCCRSTTLRAAGNAGGNVTPETRTRLGL